ncbi:type I polyketide synthase [Saccharomonospora azurea]
MQYEYEIAETDIAIIGMACRFPGAATVHEFWENLRSGVDSVTFFSDDELRAEGVPDSVLADPNYVKAGQVLSGVDRFDADYFRIPHDEAEILDPQHRQFLECSVEALEDAGYDPGRFPGRIGVYAGAGMNTYLLSNLADRYHSSSAVGHYRFMLANDKDFLATRVSYKLNLQGPSVNVGTACSTSLVAVHLAGMGLLSGECDIALAGAVHVKVPHRQGYAHQEGMIFSPDGHCRAFDAKAQGTVIGSGVGVVVLKPLAEAVEDGDVVHAVIKGSAVNNDGAVKAGYTAPSAAGQAAVVTEALSTAGCPPESVSYVEAHGTGTPLGDPIEVEALSEVFAEHAPGRCALGSVKTNVGHLDTAAGMAGLIKTALMLRHRTLVPSLHFDTPNPDIDFTAGPFRVVTEPREWNDGNGPLRAGVSSFGIGGTNAHVVLQEAPVPDTAPPAREAELLVLSARSEKALDRLARSLSRYLRRHSDLELGSVARTLAVGRATHAHRRAFVCRNTRQAAKTLALATPGSGRSGAVHGDVAFAFLCGGEPDNELFLGLHGTFPVFRDAVDECVRALGTRVASATSLLGGEGAVASVAGQYALAKLWESWGLRPDAVVGEGAGELVAGHLAGVLDLDAVLTLAWSRDSGGGSVPDIRAGQARIPVGVDGRWLTPDELADPRTWATASRTADGEHVRDVESLLSDAGLSPVPVCPGRPGDPALDRFLDAVGDLWCRGAEIDWTTWYGPAQARRVSLPTYPFEPTRHWVDAPRLTADAPAGSGSTSLRHRIDAAEPAERPEILCRFLQKEISTVLGRADSGDLDPDANLFELEVDSLILIDMTARLGTELGISVPSSAFIEHPTVNAFVASLARQLGMSTIDAGPQDEDRLTARTSRRAARIENEGVR